MSVKIKKMTIKKTIINKKPLVSKVFTFKGWTYVMELTNDIENLELKVNLKNPKHAPVCEDDRHEKMSVDYNIRTWTSNHPTPKTNAVSELIIDSHKKARLAINNIIELEKNINSDFFVLAADVDDVGKG